MRELRKGGRFEHTLSHEIFQVMPLNIIRKVSDVDTTVLLRAITETLHHGVFRSGAFFVTSTGSTDSSAPCVSWT